MRHSEARLPQGATNRVQDSVNFARLGFRVTALLPHTCARTAAAKAITMQSGAVISDWSQVSEDMRTSLSREALRQARQVIGAQAALLADQMEAGVLAPLEGPDALRLLAMILGEDDTLRNAA
jgi:hypothetical protein